MVTWLGNAKTARKIVPASFAMIAIRKVITKVTKSGCKLTLEDVVTVVILTPGNRQDVALTIKDLTRPVRRC